MRLPSFGPFTSHHDLAEVMAQVLFYDGFLLEKTWFASTTP